MAITHKISQILHT